MNIRTYPRAQESTRTRKTRSTFARLVGRGALLTLAPLALVGCGRGDSKTSVRGPSVVRVVEVDATRRGTKETVHYTGVVRARTESNLGFRVAGKIAERLVNAGDVVKKDEPLLKLDPVD